VSLNFLDDIFLLNFALKSSQSAFERLAILQMDFCQTKNSPPSGIAARGGAAGFILTRILPREWSDAPDPMRTGHLFIQRKESFCSMRWRQFRIFSAKSSGELWLGDGNEIAVRRYRRLRGGPNGEPGTERNELCAAYPRVVFSSRHRAQDKPTGPSRAA
jgi:hypothetical protein